MKKMKMNLRKFVLTGPATAFLALGGFAAAQANNDYGAVPDADLETCIARINDRADYSDAGRVRHDVLASKRRTVGYLLAIETTVYARDSVSVVREYKTICVTTGREQPARFEITEEGV